MAGGGADVGELIRNLNFDPLGRGWQLQWEKEQGTCEGSAEWSVLEKVAHKRGSISF